MKTEFTVTVTGVDGYTQDDSRDAATISISYVRDETVEVTVDTAVGRPIRLRLSSDEAEDLAHAFRTVADAVT